MQTEHKQVLIDAGFEPTALGWQRQVGSRIHTLSDAYDNSGCVDVWYASVCVYSRHRDSVGNVTASRTNSAYICCAPDPVTAMVYADIEGWKPTAFIEYFNCIRIGFGHE